MNVGIIGGGGGSHMIADILTQAVCAAVTMTNNAPKPVRYTYQDDDGVFTRAYQYDSVSNRHTFVELLQNTEFCYQESDIQKFIANKEQNAILVENI